MNRARNHPIGADTKPTRPRLDVSLSVWVSGICLLAVVPMLVFSALILYRDIAEQQRRGLAALERRATVTAAAIGHELDSVFTELTILSLVDSARQGDLEALHGLAVRVVAADPRIASISLSARSGAQPFITSRPFGAVLPDSNVAALLQPLFEGSDRVVGPLVVGAVSKQAVVGVARPIDLGRVGVFALRAVVRHEAIGARLNEQAWPADWTATIIDQNGIIIARSRDADRFVGHAATPGLLERAKESQSAFHAITKDGVATVASAAPVPASGWHVVVGQPRAALEAQVRDSITTVLVLGALCAALGIGAASFFGRATGRHLRRVVGAHVGGAAMPVTAVGIKEVGEVADALTVARETAAKAFAELVTARELAVTQLRERTDMLDVLAHEVRQPLNNASAALQQARRVFQQGAPPGMAAPLRRTEGVLGEVVASIDNTLAVASLLVGEHHVQRGDVDIDTLVGVAIADMPADQMSRVRVERVARTRTASMEPHLMRLALRNLLSNALKFSPPGSPVIVRISDSDEPLAVIVDVIDAGTGIDDALLPRLFDRGERKRQKLGGRRQGLGLYIVRRVMQLHGGSVTLARNGDGGTTMRLVVAQGGEE